MSPRTTRSTAPPTRPPLPKGFGVIWTTVAIDLIGFGIVLPILPRYAEEFGATPIQIGFLVASFSFAQMLAAPVMGEPQRSSDSVSAQRVGSGAGLLGHEDPRDVPGLAAGERDDVIDDPF